MALTLDGLGSLVRQGFDRASITTAAGLKDDATVRAAARHIYDVIPFPLNLAVKMSVGVEGLERFALTVRDRLLAAGVTDIAKLGPSDWRALLASSLAAVPALGRLMAPGGAAPEPAAGSLSAAIGADRPADRTPATEVTPPEQAAPTTPMATSAVAPETPAPRVWYLRRQDAQYGPWPDATFVSFVEQGRLDRTDLVWRDGFPGWIALRDLPQLSGRLARRH